MKEFIYAILNGEPVSEDIKATIREKMTTLAHRRLVEAKKALAAETFGESVELDEVATRIRLVRGRIRHGQVQRRKKVSGVKGYSYRGGKLVRISSTERVRRRKGGLRGARKRRTKRAQSLRKYKLALRKRRALGLK